MRGGSTGRCLLPWGVVIPSSIGDSSNVPCLGLFLCYWLLSFFCAFTTNFGWNVSCVMRDRARPIHEVTFPVLVTLDMSRYLGSLLRSIVSTMCPLFGRSLSLDFTRVKLVALICRVSTSMFRPLANLVFSGHPVT